MSQERRTDVDFDLAVMEEAAGECGLQVFKDHQVLGWNREILRQKAELVLRNPRHHFDIGFVREGQKIQMVADHHGGFVDDELRKVVPRYMEKITERESRGRFKNPIKQETDEHVILRYKV